MKLKYSPDMTIKCLKCFAEGRSIGSVVIGMHPTPTPEQTEEAKRVLASIDNLGFFEEDE